MALGTVYPARPPSSTCRILAWPLGFRLRLLTTMQLLSRLLCSHVLSPPPPKAFLVSFLLVQLWLTSLPLLSEVGDGRHDRKLGLTLQPCGEAFFGELFATGERLFSGGSRYTSEQFLITESDILSPCSALGIIHSHITNHHLGHQTLALASLIRCQGRTALRGGCKAT